MDEQIKRLTEQMVKALDESERIRAQYAGKSDNMSAEELSRWSQLLDEADNLKAQLDNLKREDATRKLLAQPNPMLPLAGAHDAAAAKAMSYGLPIDLDALQPRTAEERAAWKSFMRGTPFSEMAPDASKAIKAIIASSGDAGGFLVVPQELALRLVALVKDLVYMRQFATIQMLDKAESLGVPTLDTDLGDPTWTDELGTGAEDTVKPFGKRALTPHPLARRVKISNKLLRQASLDPEAIVLDRLSYRVARVEENAFLNGTGQNQPLGVFVADANGINTDRDTVTANGGAIDGDDLITLRHSLKPQYWGRARWIMHRLVLSEIRKLKDTGGEYLWQPGLGGYVAQGTALIGPNPDTILGFPVIMSEMAPSTIATGDYVAVLGDYSFYWIADALDIQIQRLTELYAETNQTGFILRKESDGMPVLSEAFVRLQIR